MLRLHRNCKKNHKFFCPEAQFGKDSALQSLNSAEKTSIYIFKNIFLLGLGYCSVL